MTTFLNSSPGGQTKLPHISRENLSRILNSSKNNVELTLKIQVDLTKKLDEQKKEITLQVSDNITGKMLIRKILNKLQSVNKRGIFSEHNISLFIPSYGDHNEIKLDPNYPLWVYDLQPMQTISCREIGPHESFENCIYIKLLIHEKMTFSIVLDGQMTVREALFNIQATIKPLLNLDPRFFGLYLYTDNGGYFLDNEKKLKDCNIFSMDLIEFKKISIYEAEFISNGNYNHPNQIAISPSMTVAEILEIVLSYFNSEDKKNHSYGILYVPIRENNSIEFKWMDPNQVISEYPISVDDILDIKIKDDSSLTKSLNSTIAFISSTKLIIRSIPRITIENVTGYGKFEINLEEGEKIIEQRGPVSFLNSQLFPKKLTGKLVVTNFKLMYIGDDHFDSFMTSYFTIPLGTISKIEKIGNKTQKTFNIEIQCKDLRSISFEFISGTGSRRAIFKVLDEILFNGKSSMCAFSFRSFPLLSLKFDGWNVFDMEKEFARLTNEHFDPSFWRISDVNNGYAICETYPQKLIVPKYITDQDLKSIASFRSKGRIPVVDYIYPSNSSVLLRSSQPLIGIKRSRCIEDEALIQMIRDVNSNTSGTFYIFDARPKANAVANIPMGGGYENVSDYANTIFEFLNVPNIHAMRESLNKIQSLVSASSDENWFSNLQDSHWLEYIKLMLEGTIRIIQLMDSGSSILIHCSDGWDRITQLSSLVQLCLDPYSRTIIGFENLIEKDWCAFGHKFQSRVGHADRNHADEQRAPIFLQFIDCVFQLISQFPCHFQFNETFLIQVLDHLYSCKFGTFLFNSDKERQEHEVKTKTHSLWTFLHSISEEVTNPLYVPFPGALKPSTNLDDIFFWKSYYTRWYRNRKKTLTIEQRVKQLQGTYTATNDQLIEAKKEIARLKKELALANQKRFNDSKFSLNKKK